MSAVLVRAQPAPHPRGAAACRGVDPEVFFPPGTSERLAEEACAVCRLCPLREECLDYALAWDVHGVWAGTTYPQRNAIRAAQGIAPLPVLTPSTVEEGHGRPGPKPRREPTPEPTPDLPEGGPMLPMTVDDAQALVLLASGETAQEAANKSGVKLAYVMRLACGQGWSVHPTTGLASDERREDGKPVVSEDVTALACQPTIEPQPNPDPAPYRHPAPPLSAAHESVDDLLDAARQLGDKKVTAALEKAETAIGKLREVYEETAARIADEKAAAEAKAAALAEVERLRAALAVAEQKAAEAGAKLRKTPSKPASPEGPSTKDVRAWAKEQGIDVPDRGRIPGPVLEKYEAAHRSVAA